MLALVPAETRTSWRVPYGLAPPRAVQNASASLPRQLRGRLDVLHQIIDRRLAGKNKSIANRERFLRRVKNYIRRAVSDAVRDRSIKDIQSTQSITIPKKDIAEPSFRHGPGGKRELVHPGNAEYIRGDKIARRMAAGAAAVRPRVTRVKGRTTSCSSCRVKNSCSISSMTSSFRASSKRNWPPCPRGKTCVQGFRRKERQTISMSSVRCAARWGGGSR